MQTLDDYSIGRFINRINQELLTKNTENAREKATMRRKEEELHNELQKVNSILFGLEERKKMTRSSMEQALQKISQTNTTLHALPANVEDLDQINESIFRADQKVTRAKQALQELENESSGTDLQRTLSTLERQAQDASDEMHLLSLQGDSRARLGLKRTDCQRKVESRVKVLAILKPECEALLKKPFQPDELDRDLNALIARQEHELKASRDAHQLKTAEMSGIEARLSIVVLNFQTKSKEYEQKLEVLRVACGKLDYQTAMKQADNEVENHRGLFVNLILVMSLR